MASGADTQTHRHTHAHIPMHKPKQFQETRCMRPSAACAWFKKMESERDSKCLWINYWLILLFNDHWAPSLTCLHTFWTLTCLHTFHFQCLFLFLKMWLDLQKPSTYAHNAEAQFSLPIGSFINKLTNHHWQTSKSKQVCFCCDYFLRHVGHTRMLRWSQNGCGCP